MQERCSEASCFTYKSENILGQAIGSKRLSGRYLRSFFHESADVSSHFLRLQREVPTGNAKESMSRLPAFLDDGVLSDVFFSSCE